MKFKKIILPLIIILSIRILNSEIRSLNVTIEENNDEHKKILSKNIPSFTPSIKIEGFK